MAGTTKPPRRTWVASALAQILLGFSLLGSVVVLFGRVYYAVKGPAVSVDVLLPWPEVAAVPGPALPPGAQASGGAGVRTVTTPPVSLAIRLFATSGIVLQALSVLVGAWCAASLVAAIGAGEPFAVRNARRWTVIGVCVLTGGVAAPWLTWWGNRSALSAIGMDPGLFTPVRAGAVASPDTGGTALLVGLIVLAMSQVFRQGSRPSEDSEGPASRHDQPHPRTEV